MSISKKILDIRKANHLSQDEFANKLFVTRQAVSRWENSETTPTVPMLEYICKTFKVDANTLFGMEEAPICQSCGVVMIKASVLGENKDESINDDFCNYCFVKGEFSPEKTPDEMVEAMMPYLDEYNAQSGNNYTEEEARVVLKEYLLTLKRWKKDIQ